ncbi:hypothetical protein [Nonomuraea recticatena]|uniref:SAM-dependent methyltransferase n=1 Tax=Nonomuraea recticatena TaxID=46178 RepID=A0ABN3SXH8_9ACTN
MKTTSEDLYDQGYRDGYRRRATQSTDFDYLDGYADGCEQADEDTATWAVVYVEW